MDATMPKATRMVKAQAAVLEDEQLLAAAVAEARARFRRLDSRLKRGEELRLVAEDAREAGLAVGRVWSWAHQVGRSRQELRRARNGMRRFHRSPW